MQQEVRVCKPSIAKRALLLLRLKSSTRSTSSNADSMMRTAAEWVCAVSLLLLSKITVTIIYLSENRNCHNWLGNLRMGAQAVQNSQLLMLHASLSRQSAMVSPWGTILHPSKIVFSFFICFSYANRNCWGNHKNWLVSLVWIRIVPYHAMTFTDGEWLWFPSLVWIRGVPGLNHLVFLEVAF